jgi:hypothetical protein
MQEDAKRRASAVRLLQLYQKPVIRWLNFHAQFSQQGAG